jgi:signal transduction histidine kinase
MRVSPRLSRFMRSDPDHAPFGMVWLRGLTPARVGLLVAICLLLALRGNAMSLLQAQPRQPILEWIADVAVDTMWFCITMATPLLLVTIADNVGAGWRTAARVGALVLAVLLGAATNAAIAFGDCDAECRATTTSTVRFLMVDFALIVSWGGLLTGALFFLQRERHMQASAHQAELDRIELDRQMAEARLQMLEAQIEPHFLFNSLATVKSLYQRDPEKGRLLIRDLSEYLRGALPLMRGADSTLRKEFALCEAYLRVLQVRMGDRLKVEIDLPRRLEHHDIPPMMLPTLIENAVKHGISPLREGGTVRIVARLNGEELQVSVADNGAGFRHTSGAGIGLANTRARLATMFGDEASLAVVANAGTGVSATLRFPARPHDAHGVA